MFIPTSKWSKPKYHKKNQSTEQVCKDSKGNIVPCEKCVPAPWMKYAIAEIGVQRYSKQKGKSGNNPRIMEYHKTTTLPKRYPKYSEITSWCGSFVNWVMIQAGYSTNEVFHPAGALQWRNFGKRCSKPVYGAIGVKKRVEYYKVKVNGKVIVKKRVKGHVSFFIGQSKGGKYYYMLGGNQTGASKVIVKRYTKKEWDQGFYVPKNYDVTNCKTPIYSGTAAKGKDKA